MGFNEGSGPVEAPPQADNSSRPITRPENVKPKRLSPPDRFPMLKKIEKTVIEKTPVQEAFTSTLDSLKSKYPELAGTYRSIFEEFSSWDLSKRPNGEPNNPEDSADFAALQNIDILESGQEKELEQLILKILHRKSGHESLLKKAKRSLIDLLS